MQKLIKLNDQHYIIVDDSEIKEGDWVCNIQRPYIKQCQDIDVDYYNKRNDVFKKITHSTQPLGKPIAFTNAFESELSLSINGLHDTVIENWVCKKLSLSEVEEAINGYSVEKMAKNAYLKHSVKDDRLSLDEQIQRSGGFNVGYSEGFKVHQELVKDKLFTVEDMLNFSWWLNKNLGQYSSDENAHFELKYFNQWKKLNPPKTEWDVTFHEQGKISLAL